MATSPPGSRRSAAPHPRGRLASPPIAAAASPPLHATLPVNGQHSTVSRSTSVSPLPVPPANLALPAAMQPAALPPLVINPSLLSRQTSPRSGRSASAVQSRTHTDDDEPRTSGEDVTEEAHPLQAEIERLTALCEDHSRKFRSSKATFEHRVFSEYPSILTRLGELDVRAEKATADLYAALHEAVPALRGRLAALEDERTADVETMRQRTTPWRDFLPEEDDKENGLALSRSRSGGGRRGKVSKIERMRGADSESDALSLIERWGEEVTISLTDQIARLKSQLFEEGRKRNIVIRLVLVLAAMGGVVLLFFALRKGHASITSSSRPA
ncbi:uncharacterized protein EHS24_005000 [Apiotrichum porosum]|uniref:Uncharacterized protein n=1 Tax=Apiotrichum porosum TaxID=105984 RepID=A0A427Y6L3_9TREE|nr:uncharacterized protein EHS24_005000 [Apiotrichum porosum]RSH86729.1 hypothetical protein EHS24_005000 [Apiotrichum porosum]